MPAGATSSTWANARFNAGLCTDDFLKIEFTANFFLKIKFFFRKLVFQLIDIFEGQSVFDRDGDLRGDLLEQLD